MLSYIFSRLGLAGADENQMVEVEAVADATNDLIQKVSDIFMAREKKTKVSSGQHY